GLELRAGDRAIAPVRRIARRAHELLAARTARVTDLAGLVARARYLLTRCGIARRISGRRAARTRTATDGVATSHVPIELVRTAPARSVMSDALPAFARRGDGRT